VALGDPLAQRRIAARRAVVERGGAVVLERGPRALAELRDRQQVGPGDSAREGDDGHAGESRRAC
jgi:hypothetical protein